MSCGCKGKKKGTTEIKTPLKIGNAIITTILLVILSPILLIVIWVVIINSSIEGNSDPLSYIIKRFNKDVDEEEESEEFDPNEYELVDVEVIK